MQKTYKTNSDENIHNVDMYFCSEEEPQTQVRILDIEDAENVPKERFEGFILVSFIKKFPEN